MRSKRWHAWRMPIRWFVLSMFVGWLLVYTILVLPGLGPRRSTGGLGGFEPARLKTVSVIDSHAGLSILVRTSYRYGTWEVWARETATASLPAILERDRRNGFWHTDKPPAWTRLLWYRFGESRSGPARWRSVKFSPWTKTTYLDDWQGRFSLWDFTLGLSPLSHVVIAYVGFPVALVLTALLRAFVLLVTWPRARRVSTD